MYSGTALSVELLPSGIAHLMFDLTDSSVNKFNQQTLSELQSAVTLLRTAEVDGLIFSHAMPAFLVGAYITEFTEMFKKGEAEIMQ